MHSKQTIDKLVENEAMFRKRNETVQEDIKTVNDIAHSHGEGEAISDEMELEFYCECSDENCLLRIPMSIERYEIIHKDRKQFVIKPGHEVTYIEEVVVLMPEYTIVKKRLEAPEEPETLNETAVVNV